VFHYPTESWGDVAVIGWLIDGAALVTQKALLDASYAPYVRAMRRICAEESLHLRHGEDITLELVSGTDAQRAMFQDAVERWWQPIMHFFGPPSKKRDMLLEWGIKTRSNESLRQEFFTTYVPKLWDVGISVPDDRLAWNEATGEWDWSEPNWDEFWVVRGNGPMTAIGLARKGSGHARGSEARRYPAEGRLTAGLRPWTWTSRCEPQPTSGRSWVAEGP
jgi:ring-1,2-phenylacetyl-CoA epoxidase subunit PaaA